VQRPLAVVVVGGMLIAPIMLLIVTPALMMMFMPGRTLPERPAPQPGVGLDP
jgi:heavy metal efflux system protein